MSRSVLRRSRLPLTFPGFSESIHPARAAARRSRAADAVVRSSIRPVRVPAAAWAGLALLAVLLAVPQATRAQTLTVAEYRDQIVGQESTLARLERELEAANAQLDRLVAERQATGSPRGQRSREISLEIVDLSQRIAELERQRRTALAEQRLLREALNRRYTEIIDANLARLGGMSQSDPAYGPLLVETGRAIGARDSLQLQIRIQETLGSFRDFPILATDGPAEIREKAGFYRDYVHDVEQRIAAVEKEIERVRDRDRVARRMRELQEDLAFQGEDAAKRPGNDVSGGDIREDPAVSPPAGGHEETRPGGLDALGQRTPEQRIADLEQEKRSLELLRGRFEAKVRDYEDRARTIYSRQTTQPGKENR